jgi:hypothetical protein
MFVFSSNPNINHFRSHIYRRMGYPLRMESHARVEGHKDSVRGRVLDFIESCSVMQLCFKVLQSLRGSSFAEVTVSIYNI